MHNLLATAALLLGTTTVAPAQGPVQHSDAVRAQRRQRHFVDGEGNSLLRAKSPSLALTSSPKKLAQASQARTRSLQKQAIQEDNQAFFSELFQQEGQWAACVGAYNSQPWD